MTIPGLVYSWTKSFKALLRAGNMRPLRDNGRRVLPTDAELQYLGPECDPSAMVYCIKFNRDGLVAFVDVDARTGQVIGEIASAH